LDIVVLLSGMDDVFNDGGDRESSVATSLRRGSHPAGEKACSSSH
jgi:hypothetical protein